MIYQIVVLIACLSLCFATAWFGSRFTPGKWYADLKKPAWTPPGYIFGAVWTVLYALMGVAAWLLWRHSGFSIAKYAFALFCVQLVLNGLWSWIFFGKHKIGIALVEILLLWSAILATVISFWHQYIVAGVLLVPYLAWVAFAAYLNFSLWIRNKGV